MNGTPSIRNGSTRPCQWTEVFSGRLWVTRKRRLSPSGHESPVPELCRGSPKPACSRRAVPPIDDAALQIEGLDTAVHGVLKWLIPLASGPDRSLLARARPAPRSSAHLPMRSLSGHCNDITNRMWPSQRCHKSCGDDHIRADGVESSKTIRLSFLTIARVLSFVCVHDSDR